MNKEFNQTPEFHGQCAFALSTGKQGVKGKENCYLIQDGKKYLFSNSVAKFLWRILPGRKTKANQIGQIKNSPTVISISQMKLC